MRDLLGFRQRFTRLLQRLFGLFPISNVPNDSDNDFSSIKEGNMGIDLDRNNCPIFSPMFGFEYRLADS